MWLAVGRKAGRDEVHAQALGTAHRKSGLGRGQQGGIGVTPASALRAAAGPRVGLALGGHRDAQPRRTQQGATESEGPRGHSVTPTADSGLLALNTNSPTVSSGSRPEGHQPTAHPAAQHTQLSAPTQHRSHSRPPPEPEGVSVSLTPRPCGRPDARLLRSLGAGSSAAACLCFPFGELGQCRCASVERVY